MSQELLPNLIPAPQAVGAPNDPMEQAALPATLHSSRSVLNAGLPHAQGLYHPGHEHDACGVSFVAQIDGLRSHRLVELAITSLCNLEHRGATGAEANSGDGAGILIQIPDEFFRAVCEFDLPQAGHYAVGIAFIGTGERDSAEAESFIENTAREEGLRVLGWRDVPIDPQGANLGETALKVMPKFRQMFVAGIDEALADVDLDRRAFVLRKRVEHEFRDGRDEAEVYFPSLSSRTLVYKGMLTTPQLAAFFPDLHDERVVSAIALVHSRFSTNTFPSWPLAHPYRYVAHNGEINTVQGNENWMRAREALLGTHLFGAEPDALSKVFPICTPGASDTARLDEALELLHLGGYPLAHAVLMLIPEAWENHAEMDEARRAFYQFHSCLMEPWDGPASVVFTDGTQVGAVLDRNGLRPSRYWVCNDGLVIMASEVGTLPIDQSTIVQKGRLQPGRMFLIDTAQGRIVSDEELKSTLAAEHPYQQWIDDNLIKIEDLPQVSHITESHSDTLREQQTFGYTHEELRILMDPMARSGYEALGSMGTDTPLAVLSNRPRLLFDYFAQLFAQVTNPPLDAIREELVTSVKRVIGPEGNLLDPQPSSARLIEIEHPILDNDSLAKLEHIGELNLGFSTKRISCLYPVAEGGAGLRAALARITTEASEAIAEGYNMLILSDWRSTEELAPIPSLLFTAAVHHHLLREKNRTQVGLLIETGDAREIHHFCLLLGYGAAAINPYLAFDSIEDRLRTGALTGVEFDQAVKNYIKASAKGILKVMSKMGISTVASYTGAQIFEAIGLGPELVNEYFTGTVSRIGGIGLDEIAESVRRRHHNAYPDRPDELSHRDLEYGGEYQWRREGEYHLFNPKTVFKLQHATRTGQYKVFKEYTALVNDQSEHLATLRGLFRFRTGERQAIPLDQVEPASEIVKRFSTGAMSYGSISAEAHETLAIAMNRLGAKSNTGEGGEDPERFLTMDNGDSKRSSIKQVASGRFGVTSEYLTNADDLQIKMAQGAKPGEGGQLPGHKVYPWVAKTRHSTPGVGLISPPPHHDIYSIEDLAQLIHDLKNSNPSARVHVKLVAEVGVGTVAAGVAKAKSDVVLISGHDGGTGASPLTSLKHAGAPWELGLAETQQTLLLNNLRDRIVVQADGQLKTGRDVMIAALLGAEEFGFATAPLVVSGCVMMRVCHLDTCPVGVATQNPELRKRFSGTPEFVENFMLFIAEEVRELLAELGFATLLEAVGHVELLEVEEAINHWKASGLDLSPILHLPEIAEGAARHNVGQQDHGLQHSLDLRLIEGATPALEDGTPVRLRHLIRNVNRTVGTMLGHQVTKKYGGTGLPEDTIQVDFVGSAGNSFGAFLPSGITLRLEGDANDYVGKGLSGGRVIVRPGGDTTFAAEENIIAGNVIGYGATGGQLLLRGRVGERFCVRNSGATAVVEGVGDHGCEYMTGGRVIVLGATGRNFGAGMSGGIAYVFDPEETFATRLNPEMVSLEALEDEDVEFLQSTLRVHWAETDSSVARAILDAGNDALGHFRKVMPKDYRKVLEATAAAVAAGTDIDEAIMEAARG